MTSGISYNTITSPFHVQVKLEGKVVGHIRTAAEGYIYVPKGQSLKAQRPHKPSVGGSIPSPATRP